MIIYISDSEKDENYLCQISNTKEKKMDEF